MAAQREVKIVINAQDKASSTLGSIGSAFGKLVAVTGGAVVGAFAAAAAGAIAYNDALVRMNIVTKYTDDQLKGIKESLKSLAVETGQSFKSLTEATSLAVGSGIEASQAVGFVRQAAIGATAGLTDTATVTQALAGALNAYSYQAEAASGKTDTMGNSVTQTQRFLDVMFKTVDIGVITFEQMSMTMGEWISTAATAKVPIETAAAAMATMTKRGVQANEASTALNQVLLAILKPSKQAEDAAKKMGIGFDQNALSTKGLAGVLGDLQQKLGNNVDKWAEFFPNVRALKGALTIAGDDISGFVGDIAAMNDSTGAAAEAFKRYQQSWSYNWNRAKNIAMNAADTIAGPVMAKLLNALVSAQPKIAAVVDGLANQLAPLTDKISQELGDIGTSFATLAQQGATVAQQNLPGQFESFKQTMSGFSPILDIITTSWNGMSSAIASVWNFMGGLTGFLQNFAPIMDLIRGTIDQNQQAWSNLANVVQSFWTIAQPIAEVMIVIFGTLLVGAIMALAAVTYGLSAAFNAMTYALAYAWSKIAEIPSGMREAAGTISGTMKGAVDGLKSAFDWLGGSIQSVLNKMNELINKAKNIPSNIGGFLGGLHFQSGGLSPGGLATVGEAGPELAYLPRGTQVMSHTASLRQLNGANGGTTQQISIGNISLPNVTNARQFLDELATLMQNQQPSKAMTTM